MSERLRCEFCGAAREPGALGVFERDAWRAPALSADGHGDYVLVVRRYCADRASCADAARAAPLPEDLHPLPRSLRIALRDEHERRALVEMVPDSLRDGLCDYLVYGLRPGAFLNAILSGNLFEAAQYADRYNLRALGSVARFIVWYCPFGSYGSSERVARWRELRAAARNALR